MSSFKRGLLSDYFEGVAVKRLSVVETTPSQSNQHEFNGSRPLRRLLGDEDRRKIKARFIWLGDEQEGITDDSTLSWYDSRRNQPHRSAEYRLYYPGNAVSDLMKAGDTLFLAVRPDGSAMVIVTPAESTIQNQLLWLFGIEEQPELQFTVREIEGDEEAKLDFVGRYVLDELGIEPEETEVDLLDSLLAKFETKFPKTKEFSELARTSLPAVVVRDDPDAALFAWMEREELMFRRLERHIVAGRIKAGFAGDDESETVDSFLSFSLSVQQRRRSRVGHALENHLEALFEQSGIRFARGAETENRNKPDFLFPGATEYHDPAFPTARLTMLGVKSTLKDRWRQVLAEANRISRKHLLTLEPGISLNQTDQIKAASLQLVIPKAIHASYDSSQQAELLSVQDFLTLVHSRQSGT